MKKIRRVSAQEGYDLWAETYDETPNPVVAMDARHTLEVLAPKPGEQILDAGCGTGRHLGPIILAGSSPVGVDFSRGMLDVAQRNYPEVPLVLADLQRPLPFEDERFDAVLCADRRTPGRTIPRFAGDAPRVEDRWTAALLCLPPRDGSRREGGPLRTVRSRVPTRGASLHVGGLRELARRGWF